MASALSALAHQSVAGLVVIAPQTAAAAALRSMPLSIEPDTGGEIPAISVGQVTAARVAVQQHCSAAPIYPSL
ncbi:hypothetical protein [Dactylosporangium sp. CA-233914]|uniref:hypothetical protein n=1 Tax=Dactylosporangium sp. CA-233914 TaxID=3239934 RepID=UPI003D933BAD